MQRTENVSKWKILEIGVAAISLVCTANAGFAQKPSPNEPASDLTWWMTSPSIATAVECANVSDHQQSISIEIVGTDGLAIRTETLTLESFGSGTFTVQGDSAEPRIGALRFHDRSLSAFIFCQAIVQEKNAQEGGDSTIPFRSLLSLPMIAPVRGERSLYIPMNGVDSPEIALSHDLLLYNPTDSALSFVLRTHRATQQSAIHLELPPHAAIKRENITSTGNDDELMYLQPDEPGIPFYATLVRHISGPKDAIAHASLSLSESICDSGPLNLGTGNNSVEIENPSARSLTVSVDTINRFGVTSTHKEISIPGENGRRVSVSKGILTDDGPAFVRVRCTGSEKDTAGFVLTASNHVLAATEDGLSMMWAYSLRPSPAITTERSLAYIVNRNNDAKNSLMISERDTLPVPCEIKLLDAHGTLSSEQAVSLIPGCVTAVRLHAQTDGSFFGLAITDTRSVSSHISAILLRSFRDEKSGKRIVLPMTGFPTNLPSMAAVESRESSLAKQCLDKFNEAYKEKRTDKTRAIQLLEQTVQICPRYHCAQTTLAGWYRETGRTADLDRVIDQLLAIDPSDSAALQHKATSRLLAGDPQGALALYQQVAKSEVNSARAQTNLAAAFSAVHRSEERKKALLAALRINKDDVEANFQLNMARFEENEKELALEGFRKTWEILNDPSINQPEIPKERIEALKIFTLRQLNRVSEAAEQGRKSARLFPDSIDIKGALGLALLEAGSAAEAIPVLQDVLKILPTEPTYHLNLGLAYEKTKELDKSLDEARLVQKLDPRNPWGFNNAGWILSLKGKVFEAYDEYIKANEINPTDPIILANLRNIRLRIAQQNSSPNMSKGSR